MALNLANGNEMCDDGNAVSGDDCSADCQRVLPGPCNGPHCNEPSNRGDGTRQSGEECDLGPGNEDGRYNGCSTACTLNVYCGDGAVQYHERCDLGVDNQDPCGWCSTQCVPRCGDGVEQKDCGEVCDDGVNSGKLGSCSPNCKTPYCGDGVIEPEIGEECDPGAEDGSARPWPLCSGCVYEWMR